MTSTETKTLYDLALQYIDFDRPTRLAKGRERLPFSFQFQQCGSSISVRMNALLAEARMSVKPCEHCKKINESKPEQSKSIPCVRSESTIFNQCAMCIILRKANKTCKLADEKDDEVNQESLLPQSTLHDSNKEQRDAWQNKDKETIGMKRKNSGFEVDDIAMSHSKRRRGTTKGVSNSRIVKGHPTEEEDAERDTLPNEIPQMRKASIEAPSYHNESNITSKFFTLAQSRANDGAKGHSKKADTDHDLSKSPRNMLRSVIENHGAHGHEENPYNRLRQEERRVAELTEKVRKLQTDHQEEVRMLKVEINDLRRKVESDEKIQKLQHERAFKAEKDAQSLRRELLEIKTKQ